MAERLIKSKARVRSHGEVFTPKRIVKLMLDQPGVREASETLDKTFLEPSAGEGAFLIEILKRKTKVALSSSHTRSEYNQNVLIALSSLYGIELLQDNVKMLAMNMYAEFEQAYQKGCLSLGVPPNPHVLQSAETIIRANMVQGDSLKQVNNLGQPIVFSEWKTLPTGKKIVQVQRTEYTLEAILEGGGPIGQASASIDREIDLFAGTGEFDDADDLETPNEVPQTFLPVKYVDIYRELLTEP
ncbi:N-6 DNA methylase [Lapidilactobacillus salsurivasis]